MGEYIPTEQELVDVLCAIRETDWEAAVKRSNNYRSNSDSIRIRGGYKRFIKDFKNLRDISQEYMRTPAQWRYCTFPFILGQIVNSPKEDQRLLLELVDRHKVAARERLLDVVWWEWYEAGEDKSLLERKPLPEIVEQRVEEKLNRFPQDSLGDGDENNKVMWEFLGDSEWQEFGVDAKSLVWRILVAQQLIKLIGEAIGQVQTQTPAPAGDQAKKNSRPGAAKRPAIEFIKERVQCDPKFTPLQQMKQGKHGDFKNLKNALWELFLSESPAMKDRITKGTFSDYVGNAVSELLPDR